MEAKETVMDKKQIDNIPASIGNIEPVDGVVTTEMIVADSMKLVAEAQAEISFKAGYEERDKWLSPDEVKRLEKARQAGIKEVVEWIHNHGGSLDGCRQEWQVKLKEWGISPNGESEVNNEKT